jgi:hypothetical protein
MALSLSGDGTLSGVDIAASGLGKVLQVVRATDGTGRNTTSATFVDANISVTITPQKSDSAILLVHTGIYQVGTSGEYMETAITDSSNNTISGATAVQLGAASAGNNLTSQITSVAYATPATTSAVTYKLRFRRLVGSGTVSIRNDSNGGQLFAIEVAA